MSSFENYPRISPFLWFDSNAEEAVEFYIGIFKNSRRLDDLRDNRSDAPGDRILTIGFELDGQAFTAINGGPAHAHFTEAISFVVRCDSQEEVDYYYAKLLEGGVEVQCGWLKDKFGLAWQIVPARISEYIRHPQAMQAMLQMKKLNIAELQAAARS